MIRLLSLVFIPALLLAPVVLAQPAQPQPVPQKANAGPAMPPAPYAPWKAGTILKYTQFENKITRVDGWRVTFQDAQGKKGGWIGGFIPDTPDNPLQFDPKAMEKIWPIKLGISATVITRRGPLSWKWVMSVTRTELVKTSLGTFKTYVVDAIESPLVTDKGPYVMLHRWWYAPDLRAVLRYRSLQVGNREGRYVNQPVQTELRQIDKAH